MTSEQQNARWRRWSAAARQPPVDDAVARLYAELDAAVATRGATCWISGKCCNFDAYGHRLYVTGLEIAWFLQHTGHGALQLASAAAGRDGCPWQVNRLCTAHQLRPLGCRVFFCQQGTEQWQQQVYEQFLTKLKNLHDDQHLPYAYMEWRSGLSEAAAALAQADTAPPNCPKMRP